MRKKYSLFGIIAFFVFMMTIPMTVQAGFQTSNGQTFYYTSKGTKKTGWLKKNGKRYYFNASGVMQTGWQVIDGKYYFFTLARKQRGVMKKGWLKYSGKTFFLNTNNGKLHLGWFPVNGKKYYATTGKGVFTGIQNIDGKSYLFNSSGVLQTGWKTYNGNRYYCIHSTGALAKGLGSISGKLYYFDSNGVMQKNTSITVNGTSYNINMNGICTAYANSSSYDLIFFTRYECGSAPEDISGYAQTGGDNGNAYGKYQFDRRYSLVDLVKYCYNSDPVTFAAFEPFKNYQNIAKYTDRFINDAAVKKQFTNAWLSIYRTSPYAFKKCQDDYAKRMYYTSVENQLNTWGINLSGRPDIVKGTVFSYAIQHGSSRAAYAVLYAGIKNTTSNEEFIRKLYDYRWKDPAGWNKRSIFLSRYNAELADALKRLGV